LCLFQLNPYVGNYVLKGMKTITRYRREGENYMPLGIHQYRTTKHDPSHVRFVVPWQMVEVKKEKEESNHRFL